MQASLSESHSVGPITEPPVITFKNLNPDELSTIQEADKVLKNINVDGVGTNPQKFKRKTIALLRRIGKIASESPIGQEASKHGIDNNVFAIDRVRASIDRIIKTITPAVTPERLDLEQEMFKVMARVNKRVQGL